jgi:hypothetical protein
MEMEDLLQVVCTSARLYVRAVYSDRVYAYGFGHHLSFITCPLGLAEFKEM